MTISSVARQSTQQRLSVFTHATKVGNACFETNKYMIQTKSDILALNVFGWKYCWAISHHWILELFQKEDYGKSIPLFVWRSSWSITRSFKLDVIQENVMETWNAIEDFWNNTREFIVSNIQHWKSIEIASRRRNSTTELIARQV